MKSGGACVLNLPATEALPWQMAKALALAKHALNITSPNPRVGCVIASGDGQVLGEGHTQMAGGAHAEVMALRDAVGRGHTVVGATAYVTLEPCSHQGRTGPCCDALVQAGVAKVVAAIQDPNPLVAGQGLARLRSAGLSVEVGPGAAESRELNIGFFSRFERKRPWVRMKIAASLDGKTALPDGRSQWITGAQARADGHAWRARACAVLTGIGTVLADDPRLDVREVSTPRQPRAVLVDSRLEVPLDASFFIAGRGHHVYTKSTNAEKIQALRQRGIDVRQQAANEGGKVDLSDMMSDLARLEINELHVEAGDKLNASLLRAGLVDELLIYVAPRWMGQGRGMADIGPLKALTDMLELTFTDVETVGPDLRILARRTHPAPTPPAGAI